MFSLITIVVAVVLVVALLIATAYHSGDTLEKARADARAAEIIQQGQQLTGAAVVYNANTGAWPESIQVLIDGGYIKSLPAIQIAQAQPKFEIISSAYAADFAYWVMPTAGQPTFKLSLPVPELDCRAINKHVRGDDGILTKATREKSAQCYGEKGLLTVVVNADGSHLDAALPSAQILESQSGGTGPGGTVKLSDVLGNPSSAFWTVAPGEASASPTGTPAAAGDLAWQLASELSQYNLGDWSWFGPYFNVPMVSEPHFSFNDSNSGIGLMPYFGSVLMGNISVPEGQSLQVTNVSVAFSNHSAYGSGMDGVGFVVTPYAQTTNGVLFIYNDPAEYLGISRDVLTLRLAIMERLEKNNDSRVWQPDSSLIPLNDPRFQTCDGYPLNLGNGFKIICQKFGIEESGDYYTGGVLGMSLADAVPTTVQGSAECGNNICSLYVPNQGNYFYDTAEITLSYTVNGVAKTATKTVRVNSYDRGSAGGYGGGPVAM